MAGSSKLQAPEELQISSTKNGRLKTDSTANRVALMVGCAFHANLGVWNLGFSGAWCLGLGAFLELGTSHSGNLEEAKRLTRTYISHLQYWKASSQMKNSMT
jgi:hypothetical protein